MNIRTRAKNLASKTGWPYQRAHQEIVSLGTRASDFARSAGWPLDRAEVYLVDPMLDEEYANVADRHTEEMRCENCDTVYFRGSDKKGLTTGGSEKFCPDCIDGHGVWTCSECGEEQLGEDAGEVGICPGCWSYKLSRD